jgi:hypothetical protein
MGIFERENLPSFPVVVPKLEPFNNIFASDKGILVSLSITTPVILPFGIT